MKPIMFHPSDQEMSHYSYYSIKMRMKSDESFIY